MNAFVDLLPSHLIKFVIHQPHDVDVHPNSIIARLVMMNRHPMLEWNAETVFSEFANGVDNLCSKEFREIVVSLEV